MQSMRRSLFVLLILLTALRGWVGDAMAYGMTNQSMQIISAMESIAHRADAMPANGHFSSENATSMPCHDVAENVSPDGNSHACNSCMVCHSPVIQRSAAVTDLSQYMAAYATAQDRAWVSADVSPLEKPPVF